MNRWIRAARAGAVAASCAAAAGGAQADVSVLGYDWSFLPAPRVIAWTVCTGGFTEAELQAIEAGITVWNKPVALSLSVVRDPTCTVNTGFNACTPTRIIDKGAFVQGAPELETNRLAAAYVCNEPAAKGNMKGCDIRVFTEPAFHTGPGQPPKTEHHLRSVIAHEFGHCLGFDDQKTDAKGLMYYKLEPGELRDRPTQEELTERDRMYD